MTDAITAAELRGRARSALGQNGAYGTFFFGVLALSVALTVVVVALAVLFFGGAAGGALGAEAAGIHVEKDSVPLFVLTICLSAVFVFGVLYAVAFSWWSHTAMGLATVRGGLRFAHAFSGWGNGWRMVSLMLWQSTFITFWLLLFIIPGIRAAFSYVLAPYLQVDHPDWEPRRCIAESKRMMEGHRLRFFSLCLSFAGWWLLVVGASLLPFVGNFAQLLFAPYFQTALAAFYEDMLDREDARNAPPQEYP